MGTWFKNIFRDFFKKKSKMVTEVWTIFVPRILWDISGIFYPKWSPYVAEARTRYVCLGNESLERCFVHSSKKDWTFIIRKNVYCHEHPRKQKLYINKSQTCLNRHKMYKLLFPEYSVNSCIYEDSRKLCSAIFLSNL